MDTPVACTQVKHMLPVCFVACLKGPPSLGQSRYFVNVNSPVTL